MKICMVGTGYVGLVAGAGFSDMGNEVVCVDIDETKIACLLRGELPIYEPGLEPLVERNRKEGRLTFTTDLPGTVRQSQLVFLAVGTPEGVSGAANLDRLFAAAEVIGQHLRSHTLVVTKSTVPVGTGDAIRNRLKELTNESFSVCSNPEFLKEGNAVNDFMRPERVILGADDAAAIERLRYLYEPFVRTSDRCIVMDVRSAELTKYAANAMLATRISFMNEIARVCEKVGADIEFVRRGLGSDGRIGPKFLFPGVGYGGSCFPKDLRALMHTAEEAGAPLEVIEAVERVNERQKVLMADKILEHFASSTADCQAIDRLRGRRIAVWGLAFKPGTDDVREAPALPLVQALLGAGAEVVAHDPAAMNTFAQMIGEPVGLSFADGPYEAVRGAHALVLMTEWGEYRRPSFERIRTFMKEPILFDGRNIWNPAELRRLGFCYRGIGRR